MVCSTSLPDYLTTVMQKQEEDEEEDEQEVLALPAPGDDLSQEGQLEAEMHAAIASAELADYAQVSRPPMTLIAHPPPPHPTSRLTPSSFFKATF